VKPARAAIRHRPLGLLRLWAAFALLRLAGVLTSTRRKDAGWLPIAVSAAPASFGWPR
jgi:hypothetical protein